jgi:hypothetical protein
MKPVLQTNDPARMAFAKALLAGEHIAAFELDVHTSILEGSIGAIPRRLMVAARDHARATQALRDNGLCE